jgi:hypothetical protein
MFCVKGIRRVGRLCAGKFSDGKVTIANLIAPRSLRVSAGTNYSLNRDGRKREKEIVLPKARQMGDGSGGQREIRLNNVQISLPRLSPSIRLCLVQSFAHIVQALHHTEAGGPEIGQRATLHSDVPTRTQARRVSIGGRVLENSISTLFRATVTDHLHVRHGHVTMLGRVLIDAVFLGLGLRVFFHAVCRGVRDYAGYRDGMRDMISELDGVALDLPSGTLRRRKFVLIGVVALLKAASERPSFLMGGFGRVLRGSQSNTGKHDQPKKYYYGLQFHSVPPRCNLEAEERTRTRMVDYAYLKIP